MARFRRPRGFTLVELLVVLAIAGLLVSAVMLTLPDGSAGFDREIRALGERLVRARQEAILGTREVEVRVDASGHVVSRRGLEGWVPLDAAPFEPVAWDAGTTIVPADAPVRFRFDATGAAQPAAVVLAHGDERVGIALDAHGAVAVDAAVR